MTLRLLVTYFCIFNIKMKWLLLTIFLLPTFVYSQIKIDDVGDNWKLRVDTALQIVKKYDTLNYQFILENCKRVAFWNGGYSTIEDSQTVVITRKDIQYSSINNIAAILVHESTHLRILKLKLTYKPNKEEVYCYYTELEFLEKIPNVEEWLITNAKKMILHYDGQ